MKDNIISQCLDILKRDNIKYELRKLLTPIINLILYEIYPYIYFIIGITILLFITNLAILSILLFFMRNNI